MVGGLQVWVWMFQQLSGTHQCDCIEFTIGCFNMQVSKEVKHLLDTFLFKSEVLKTNATNRLRSIDHTSWHVSGVSQAT